MGYPRGEIPMLDVHGQAVAGATFPVPIWHLYMEQAEKNRPAREFQTPSSYPTFAYFQKGYWGYLAVPVAPATDDHDHDHDHDSEGRSVEGARRGQPGTWRLAAGGQTRGVSGRRRTTRPVTDELLTISEALELVLEHVVPLEPEDVPLDEAAGRVLAAPAAAAVDLPSFPASAMDGFALRAADAPATLPVVARIAAGRPVAEALEAGQAMAIATGGVVPDGADSVVPIEDVEERDGVVVVPGAVETGANVRPRGGDLDRRRPWSWPQERASARSIWARSRPPGSRT